jgi:hypothetical protein
VAKGSVLGLGCAYNAKPSKCVYHITQAHSEEEQLLVRVVFLNMT